MRKSKTRFYLILWKGRFLHFNPIKIHGGFGRMFDLIQLCKAVLNDVVFIPARMWLGSMFHSVVALNTNPPLDRDRFTWGTSRVLSCLWGKAPPPSLVLSLNFPAKYPGWPVEMILWVVVRVRYAVNCMTDKSLVAFNNCVRGVSRGKPDLILITLFWSVCNFLLSSLVYAENLRLFSSNVGSPHTFPKSCKQ